jgi:hypothetical protein
MILLRKKADSFIDAIDMDVNIVPYTAITDDNNMDSSPTFGESVSRTDDLLEIDSYFILMRQLAWIQSREDLSKWEISSDSAHVNLSLDAYQELLKDLTQKLTDYRSILVKKLNAGK